MTYSIVARDPGSGELGVAVQSHYFSVGPTVPWARPGVGAVATQSMVEASYGPLGLELMAAGASAAEALEQLLGADPGRESRQVAMVDARGGVAAHTGDRCIVNAGDVQGDGVSAQANIMVSPEVWGAMVAAYERARSAGAPMAWRLLDALDAAEALGGDARGRQSAALLVVPGEGEAWATEVELRVEDHPEPLVELRRLLSMNDAYALANRGDDALVAGDLPLATELFNRALVELSDSHELKFWAGISLVHAGREADGLELVRSAIAEQPGWRWLLPQLSEEVAPGAAATSAALGLG